MTLLESEQRRSRRAAAKQRKRKRRAGRQQQQRHQPETLGVLWGAQAIADYIGRSLRSTFHLLEGGRLAADKNGGVWVTTRERLRRQFDGDEARAEAR
jgi:hypothetical protein